MSLIHGNVNHLVEVKRKDVDVHFAKSGQPRRYLTASMNLTNEQSIALFLIMAYDYKNLNKDSSIATSPPPDECGEWQVQSSMQRSRCAVCDTSLAGNSYPLRSRCGFLSQTSTRISRLAFPINRVFSSGSHSSYPYPRLRIYLAKHFLEFSQTLYLHCYSSLSTHR